MTEPWDITSDSELYNAVRVETGYTKNKLPKDSTDGSDLTGLVDSAKRDLALKAGVTSFYDERGTAVALLGLTCAKAKGAIENSPVVTKNLAGQDVTFRTSDGESLQLKQYERMVEQGLADANSTEAGPQTIRFTKTFLTDSSSQ